MFAATLAALVLFAADPDTAKFDDLYKTRDMPSSAASLQQLAEAFKSTSDYDKLWRATLWYDWQSEDFDRDEDTRKTLAKTGWDIGELARKANPQGLEGLYWTSVCIGNYSEAVGILKALTQGLEGKFRDPILQAAKLDPDYKSATLNFVGPEIAIGRYYDRLPWPKHSTSKAKDWLQKALKAHPESLRAHYYYADAIKGDDKDAAKKELTLVLQGDEAYDPPEARRVKKWAKTLLDKISK